MMHKIHFTPEALDKLSKDQAEQIAQLALGNGTEKIEVSVDFSLPSDYVYLQIYYTTNTVIHGGMDKEGVLST